MRPLPPEVHAATEAERERWCEVAGQTWDDGARWEVADQWATRLMRQVRQKRGKGANANDS